MFLILKILMKKKLPRRAPTIPRSNKKSTIRSLRNKNLLMKLLRRAPLKKKLNLSLKLLRNPLVTNNLMKSSLRDSVSKQTKMTLVTSSKNTSEQSARSTSSRMKTDAQRVLLSLPLRLKKVSTRPSLDQTLNSWEDTSLSKRLSLRVKDQDSNLKLLVKTPRLSSLEISLSSVTLMT